MYDSTYIPMAHILCNDYSKSAKHIYYELTKRGVNCMLMPYTACKAILFVSAQGYDKSLLVYNDILKRGKYGH